MLLDSSHRNGHGFEAKISDFGLARNIGMATKLETRTYGTITHMAPEVLACDYVSKVSQEVPFPPQACHHRLFPSRQKAPKAPKAPKEAIAGQSVAKGDRALLFGKEPDVLLTTKMSCMRHLAFSRMTVS